MTAAVRTTDDHGSAHAPAGHDQGGPGHAEPGFVWRYLFSQDHKMIAKQYLLTGLVMALVGGFLAYGIRGQLAWEGKDLPFVGQLSGDRYNAFVTMHGTIMVFWVAMPILLGALGNFLIPLMIGAPDMAFPRLNMASYWTFFVSTVVLVASFFVEGGPMSGGWTAYPPLSANPSYSGVVWGGHLWIIAVALEFVAILMGGINYLTTVMNMRAKGLSLMRLPIMVWMQILASAIFMFSVGPLVAGALMLMLDRTAGTSFFRPEGGGDPVLWQHLFWFFGHPEVYVILLPGLGVVCEVMPVFAKKPLFGYKAIVYSTIVAGVLSFVVWAHHMFIAGIDPRLAMPFSLTTLLISLPFAVFLFCCIATLWRGSIRLTTAMLFALSVVAEFLIGGCTGVLLGAVAADIFAHDTYFVVAHFHYTLFPAVILGMCGAIYYWFPKMFGRMLNEVLGKIHFAGTVIFFNLIFIPMFLMGMAGHQRRIFNPSFYKDLQHLHPLQLTATIGLLGMLAFQVPFIFNFFYSMLWGKKAPQNPWDANTLEWQAPTPTPHGNFPTPPVVHRGPYEYSVPGAPKDWLAQTDPPLEPGGATQASTEPTTEPPTTEPPTTGPDADAGDPEGANA